jgi:hypothetical protein
MGVMVALLLHRKALKRSEGATRQKGFGMGLSLDSWPEISLASNLDNFRDCP